MNSKLIIPDSKIGRAAFAQKIPTHLSVENIPQALQCRAQWLAWRLETRDGKATKVPYDVRTGRKGKSNDPATWCGFQDALTACESGLYAGIGFAFAEGDGLTGIDLDHVILPNGEIESWAQGILEQFKSTYAEISPSGTGLRLFALGKPERCGKGTINKAVEVYDHTSPRYLTVTGNRLDGFGTDIVACQDALAWLHAEYFKPREKKSPRNAATGFYLPSVDDDRAVVERALKARNGKKLAALLAGDFSAYSSQSEADAALCSIVAFWTQDGAQIDRIVRGSGLMRDKWDTKHHADGRTYGEATIESALENVGKTYADTLRERAAKTAKRARNVPPTPVSDNETWPRQEWRPESCQDVGDTDMGNAARIFDHFGRDLLFLREIGWHRWEGTRWALDEAGAKRLADGLPRVVLAEAAALLNESAATNEQRRRGELGDMATALQEWAKKCEKSATIEAALLMAERRLVIEPTEADSDPFLLAVQNGTLDLRIGQLRPSLRGDFITRGTSISFDPASTCPTFDAFLARIFRTHTEVIPFLQRAIGYTLTGDTREQCVFILHGGGANGKSTLVAVLEELLGDYSRQAAPDLLLVKTGDRHPTEIADLRGARLVATVETGEGRRMAESLLKQMSGGDRLKGRYMRRDFFEFTPTFKVWLATNHRPAIRGTDLGIWRRIRLVPFTETIADHEKDPELPAKLRAEMPGILAWAVRGCLEWQRNGLNQPAAVTEATAAYRAEQDVLATFLTECCDTDSRCTWTSASALYAAYVEWCERTGEHPEKQRSFGERLTERGFAREKGTAGVRGYLGIFLLSGASGASGSNFQIPTREKNHLADKPVIEATCATCATFQDDDDEGVLV